MFAAGRINAVPVASPEIIKSEQARILNVLSRLGIPDYRKAVLAPKG